MASTDMQRLVVALEAQTRAFEKALNRANGVANKRARAIESRFQRMNRNISTSIAGAARTWAAGIVAAIGTRELAQLSDAATRIDNALKVAGLSGKELEKVYQRLAASAKANAAPLESLVELYSRAALVQKELNISGEELLEFTDKIALALRVSGKSAAESSGALLQLSQALGSGVVRAEEFNSILEGALPIAQAAAAGIKEAGGSVARLRQLVVEGKISSEAFFKGFDVGSAILKEKVAGATLTISQRLGNLKTSLIDAARRFNNSSKAANTFGEAIDNVSDFVDNIDFDSIVSEIQKIIDKLNQGVNAVRNFGAWLGRLSGLENVGEFLTGGDVQKELFGGLTITSSKALRERIDSAFSGPTGAEGSALTPEAIRRSIQGGAPKTKPSKPGFTPVSIEDFPAGGSGGGGGGGGGGGRSGNDFQREIRQIRERTEAIRAETAAMAGLNPLIDDYGFALSKAHAEHELLNAAEKAGLAITPELKTQIDALATGYANAAAEANKLAESQDRARQNAEEMRDLGKDVLGGFINDLRAGKSASEALANALSKVADKLLEIALNSLFDGGGIFGGGGFFGGFLIPGILHKGGVAGQDGYGHGRAVSPSVFAGAKRYHRGGVAGLQPGEVPAILQKGETVIPKGARAGGQEVITINLRADESVIAEVADKRIQTAAGPIVQVSVDRSTKAVRQRMPGLIADAQTRRM